MNNLTPYPASALADELRRRGYVVLDPRSGGVLGALSVHPGGRSACYRGRAVCLTRRQSQVLAALVAAWPGAVTADGLFRAIWPDGYAADISTLRFHVKHLRALLPGLIATAPKGGGWRLDLLVGDDP